jgi:hypothetical protein
MHPQEQAPDRAIDRGVQDLLKEIGETNTLNHFRRLIEPSLKSATNGQTIHDQRYPDSWLLPTRGLY